PSYSATLEILTLSLHDALPIFKARALRLVAASKVDHYSSTSSVVPSVTFNPSAWSSFTSTLKDSGIPGFGRFCPLTIAKGQNLRSEEHTSELQSHLNLVCRLLL